MALPRLKDVMSKATAGASAAALAATLIASPPATNDAHAQQQNVAAAQVKVPMQDARGAGAEAVRMSAAVASRNAQVVVFFGDNEAAFQSTKEGVRAAIAQGLPVKGMFVGSPIPIKRLNGQTYNLNQVVFFTNGNMTSTVDNPDATKMAAYVVQELRRGYEGLLAADAGKPTVATGDRRSITGSERK